MKRIISVFIDGANFYHGLKTINSRYSDIFFDFEKFIKSIVGDDELANVYYYNAPLKENLNKHVYWNQMRLFGRLKQIAHFDVVLCKRQKRLNGNDEEYFMIKGDNIHCLWICFVMRVRTNTTRRFLFRVMGILLR